MIASFFTFFAGAVLFLFLFWKRLKEDYASEIIFKCAFSILFGIIIAWFLAVKFFPGWFLWAEFLGGLVGLTFGIINLKLRFYETLEAFIIASLPGISLMFLTDSVTNFSFISFIAFLVMLVFIFIYYFLDLHYKEFSWYRSGKVGFAGIATAALIFLVRSVVAIFNMPVLSFVSRFEAIISGSLAFICFIMILNLGRRI